MDSSGGEGGDARGGRRFAWCTNLCLNLVEDQEDDGVELRAEVEGETSIEETGTVESDREPLER